MSGTLPCRADTQCRPRFGCRRHVELSKPIRCHKLLVARMQSIITKSISDDDVKSMYSNIALLAGRKGYEVTRTSGTGGITCPQSHADLLFVLHENDSLLPNRAGKNCTV